MKRILFVCTGNTCRSPLAEGLFRDMASKEGLDVEVRSAGVSALDGWPVSENTLKILEEKGISEKMSSNAISEQWVDWADVILTMTVSHKRNVIGRFPQAVEKTFTLKEYVEDDAAVLANIAEIERLYTERELKKALDQKMTEEEQARLTELENSLPNYDIVDPFGGSLDTYRKCSEEIEQSLRKLVSKLKG